MRATDFDEGLRAAVLAEREAGRSTVGIFEYVAALYEHRNRKRNDAHPGTATIGRHLNRSRSTVQRYRRKVAAIGVPVERRKDPERPGRNLTNLSRFDFEPGSRGAAALDAIRTRRELERLRRGKGHQGRTTTPPAPPPDVERCGDCGLPNGLHDEDCPNRAPPRVEAPGP